MARYRECADSGTNHLFFERAIIQTGAISSSMKIPTRRQSLCE